MHGYKLVSNLRRQRVSRGSENMDNTPQHIDIWLLDYWL